jgi:hypothetical protein
MQEVEITLEFITPCLGNIRRPDIDRFERDSEGNVIFLASWWREVLRYGAQALGRHQGLVKRVRMHARITGDVKQFCRYYSSTAFKTHEAFLAKDCISARAMLPTGLPAEDFREILRLAGEYVGISPYGWKEGYGQFLVKDVAPVASRRPAPDQD